MTIDKEFESFLFSQDDGEMYSSAYRRAWKAARAIDAKRIAELEAQNKAMREALESLVNDLSLRAKIGQKDAQGVVACGNGVWIKANAALDKEG